MQVEVVGSAQCREAQDEMLRYQCKAQAQLTRSETQITKRAERFPPSVAKMRISYPPYLMGHGSGDAAT